MGQYQLRGTHIFDLPVKNWSGTDIEAGVGVIGDTGSTHIDGVSLPSSGGTFASPVGITVSKIVAGQYGTVRVLGVAVGVAHGTVTRWDRVRVSSTAAHMGQIKTCSATEEEFGFALDTVADAAEVRVLLLGGAKNA